MSDLQDIYIIFKDDILYEDANETLFTWIINNATTINSNGFYVKVIELDDSNIDKIASLNVKTLPALLIDSDVKTYGGNKIKEFIKKLVAEGHTKAEDEKKKKHVVIKKVETSSAENDMNDWIYDQLMTQGDDDGKSSLVEEPMESDTIMRKTQEMRSLRDAQTKTTSTPKKPAFMTPKMSGPPQPADADDLLLEKMFENQELSTN
jgi:hypothetical protein